ncbi:alpha/beta hydrolase family protein [Kitasatospora setae]|uniref:Putative esterase n=1 Tax=Kitasatospora setae (strain ATCC 33774 / DSM 43861 / JCM 3304 / KCC A-0304 / NBRC 14216 / KM-6054) TaxID=452652 RepID=E4N6G0_KITSK|nr:putative esterase [Kitasatospora setae KM-6054]
MIETIAGPSMSPPEFLAVLAALALLAVRWLPPAARPRAAVAAAGAFVLAAALLGVLGVRWQLVPVLAGGALALPFVLAPALRRPVVPGRPAWRARWWSAVPATAAGVGLVAAGPVAAWAFAVPVFPVPSGPFAVGTRVVQWTDPERPETFTADPADRRTVVVQLWYPARKMPAGTPRARYLGRTAAEARTVADALAGAVKLPGFLFDDAAGARTRSVPDAPPADGGGRFPVVLFSPGSGGARTQNTAWAEELASHGYLVAALDHPYDSAAVLLDDGRTVRTATSSTGDRDADQRLAAEWTAVRAADLRFALTELTALDAGTDPLAGRIDTGRAAAAGHSMGGAAALQAARQDARFAAAVDLDGFPHGPADPALHRPVLALTQEPTPATDPRYLPRLTEALAADSAPSYRVTVPGAAHLGFTDAPLYLPPLPAVVGTLGRTASPRLTAAATLAFLDAVLRPAPADRTHPAAALTRYGSLTVHRPAAPDAPAG